MKTSLHFIHKILFVCLLAFLAFPQPASAHSGPPGFADLAEKLLPAVVNISTTQTIAPKDDMEGMPDLQFPPGSRLQPITGTWAMAVHRLLLYLHIPMLIQAVIRLNFLL